MTAVSWYLPDPEATAEWGQRLASVLPEGLVVTLDGDLGAGKTALVRGVLHALGHTGPVRSPTYTLIEPYRVAGRRLFHLDLYRLADPEELEMVGFRDLFDEPAVVLVEWPERGTGVLPLPDLALSLVREGEGRRLTVTAPTDSGRVLVSRLGSDGHAT